jgi:hypothetical protein
MGVVAAQFPISPCIFGPDTLLSFFFSTPPIYILPLWCETEFHTDTQKQVKIF